MNTTTLTNAPVVHEQSSASIAVPGSRRAPRCQPTGFLRWDVSEFVNGSQAATCTKCKHS